MDERISTTRLSDPDPWDVVAQARSQRGPIVAGWLIATLAVAASVAARAIHALRRKPGAHPS